MFQFPTVWVENSPETLLEITLKFCIKNQYILTRSGEKFQLQENLSLPVGICERMMSIGKEEVKSERFNDFINFFKDTTQTHLRCLDLSNSSINDYGLKVLSKHTIAVLNVCNCKNLTHKCLPYISSLSNSLVSLTVGPSVQIFSDDNQQHLSENQTDHFHSMGLFSLHIPGEENEVSEVPDLYFPTLRKLVINGLKPKRKQFFADVLNGPENLNYLDLTGCDLGVLDMAYLASHKHLTSLILCDVPAVQTSLPAICKIKTLRHLDISMSEELALYHPSPNRVLKTIVECLENLESLDISGTNLAGSSTLEREASHDSDIWNHGENLTDIPGLASRVNKPLEFLGLLNTAHDACYRHDIPAKRIAGDATEEQILIAGQMYSAREQMIQRVLNDLFQIFRFSTCKNTKLALDVVMEAMRLHQRVKHVQVSGSASLFYIVKGEDKKFFNIKMRRKVIKILLDAMYYHYSDVTMLRNACLTLIHFKIPEDVFFDYERLVTLLLLIVAQENQDDFVQRIGLYLLNSLACQVDGFNKKLVGDRGAITIMLQLIEKRLLNNLCDEVMETAWSTMWNVTDETPVNCRRFLEKKGMDLFLGCLQAFPEKPELLRNMMGLLGNVAEVKELRTHLMKDEYLVVFSELLSSKSDGIEVSYNAAGILSHIASDGKVLWASHNISSVKRKEVLQKMMDAIESWDLNTKRNINYRSFEPILRLLNVNHTPEVQYWAVWALANLTKVYPEKYCSLLKEEGGIALLKTILRNPSIPQISELAVTIIKHCERYENGECGDLDDFTDDITDVS